MKPEIAPKRPTAYQQLWLGSAAANLADGIVLTAAPLLAATLTRDPVLVSGLVAAQRLPWLLLTLLSGALIDRADRRWLLVAANAVRAAALGLFAVLLGAGADHLVLLYATVFLLGAAETVVDTAALTVLPAIVPREKLETANGRIYAAQSLLNDLVGPPLGASLFAVGAVLAFASGAAAFAVAAVALIALPQLASTMPVTPQPVLAAIGEGFRWFWQSRVIRTVAVMTAVINVCVFGALGVLVLFAQERLGLDDRGYGALVASGSIGGVAGGVLAGRLVARLRPGPTIFVSNVAQGLTLIGIGATHDAVFAGAMLAMGTFMTMLSIVVIVTLRQSGVPVELLGRVTASYRMIALGALPLGALLGGVLADWLGLSAPYFVGGAGLLVLACAMLPVLTTASIEGAMSDQDR